MTPSALPESIMDEAYAIKARAERLSGAYSEQEKAEIAVSQNDAISIPLIWGGNFRLGPMNILEQKVEQTTRPYKKVASLCVQEAAYRPKDPDELIKMVEEFAAGQKPPVRLEDLSPLQFVTVANEFVADKLSYSYDMVVENPHDDIIEYLKAGKGVCRHYSLALTHIINYSAQKYDNLSNLAAYYITTSGGINTRMKQGRDIEVDMDAVHHAYCFVALTDAEGNIAGGVIEPQQEHLPAPGEIRENYDVYYSRLISVLLGIEQYVPNWKPTVEKWAQAAPQDAFKNLVLMRYQILQERNKPENLTHVIEGKISEFCARNPNRVDRLLFFSGITNALLFSDHADDYDKVQSAMNVATTEFRKASAEQPAEPAMIRADSRHIDMIYHNMIALGTQLIRAAWNAEELRFHPQPGKPAVEADAETKKRYYTTIRAAMVTCLQEAMVIGGNEPLMDQVANKVMERMAVETAYIFEHLDKPEEPSQARIRLLQTFGTDVLSGPNLRPQLAPDRVELGKNINFLSSISQHHKLDPILTSVLQAMGRMGGDLIKPQTS